MKMTTLLTIITILAIIFGGLWKLAEKKYEYFSNNFDKILYALLSFIAIPSLWEFIIFIFKKTSEKKIEKDCHLKNIEMFNELSISNSIYLTLFILSISSSLFVIFLLKIFNPKNKN